MNKVVIIGAGPVGLYLAYKLKMKGINPTIFDPRAGVYLRPGHVNAEDMEKVLSEINEAVLITGQIHIKDIERVLYDKIQTLYIPVEKKLFIRLSTEGKGIIVANNENIEEFVECDFVFDCTGSKRSVVKAVNSTVSPAPFTIKPIYSEVNVKNNFLAYVDMTASNQRIIDLFEKESNTLMLGREKPLAYVKRIEQLRALGWKELGYPKYYSVKFSKNKVCIYMEAPDNLPSELQSTWVETLLRSMSGVNSISFQQLPPSNKPRFIQFQVYPQEVLEVAYENKNHPTVIPLGDAQMEPHYRLALGLKSGMGRVDILIDHLEAYQNNIAFFDAQEYFELIKASLGDHKRRIGLLYAERAEYHKNWLLQAEEHYKDAIQEARKQQIPTINFEKTRVEIKAQIKYKEAKKLVAKLGSNDKITQLVESNPEQIESQLSSIYNLLINAQANLPESFTEEHAKLTQNLAHLANIWNKLGDHYFKELLFSSAKSMYEKGLAVYKNIKCQEAHALHELTLYFNLIVSKRKLNENEEIIELGTTALAKYPKKPELMVISKTILAHLLLATEEMMQSGLLTGDELKKQVREISELYPELIDKNLKKNLEDAGNTTNYLQEFGLFKYDAEVATHNIKQAFFTPNHSL